MKTIECIVAAGVVAMLWTGFAAAASSQEPAKLFSAQDIATSKVNFTTTEDRFTGEWTRRLAEGVTMKSGHGLLGKPVVMLDIVRIRMSEGNTQAFIQLGMLDSEWAFYNGAVQLILNGDQRLSLPNAPFEPIQSQRKVLRGSSVYEGINIPITHDDVEAIGSALSIEARIVGERKSCEVTFTRDAIAAFHLLRAEENTPSAQNPDTSRAK